MIVICLTVIPNDEKSTFLRDYKIPQHFICAVIMNRNTGSKICVSCISLTDYLSEICFIYKIMLKTRKSDGSFSFLFKAFKKPNVLRCEYNYETISINF